MSIDGCQRSFEELAHEVLPDSMRELNRRMATPVPLTEFATKGVGRAALMKRYGLDRDPSGCYVLLEAGKARYVGISKHVIERLLEHVRGTDHFTATLAYRIAAAEHPEQFTTSAIAMGDPDFHARFAAVQAALLTWEVAFIEIENPLELYLFEAYCALELDTGLDAGGWNTFATH